MRSRSSAAAFPRRACFPGAIVAVALLLGGQAGATVMIPLSPEELARQATHVVEGQVEKGRVIELDGNLWTETVVRVVRAHKGALDLGARLRVRQLGGELGRRGLRVVGTARFREGEQVLLLLQRIGSYYVTVGMCQGKYTITRGADGVRRVLRDLSGAAFASRARDGRPVIVPAVRVVGAPDDTLASLLQALRGGAR